MKELLSIGVSPRPNDVEVAFDILIVIPAGHYLDMFEFSIFESNFKKVLVCMRYSQV